MINAALDFRERHPQTLLDIAFSLPSYEDYLAFTQVLEALWHT
jgi:hypothetical protein